ncbi:hypothetical protein [Jannaschia seohaensis]|uniref:Uncharacterized protein n=1 Tax=Jannaschia seohaensis TaxID=475081 RepID=A0A2Y9AMQ6_9RHOB|nr:hypothetical protein [Jannaschia seohaensis]PWJ19120.1 hypothetical protein BCF38_10451 [Jannaschia seohaensis]SSA45761.1 hypothetical protein SAMN05421539_10451 [Jannaschia seohaensis]
MAEVYAPRLTARLPDREAFGIPIKMHWIDLQGQAAPPGALLASAWACVAEVLPAAMAEEGGSEGAAFCVLHRGAEGVWLLMDWWAHGDILCQRLARADMDADPFELLTDRPLLACVWELEVIARERAAWIAHMMGPVPNRSAWLRA